MVLDHPPHLLEPRHPPLKFEGSSTHPERQEKSHPHQVVVHNDELLIPDLGTDKVWRLSKDAESRWNIKGFVPGVTGAGMRHIVVYGMSIYSSHVQC